MEHDPYCKSYHPALTDPKTCTWCYVIRRVRTDEYLQAWNEGFGIGFEEGKQVSLNEDIGYQSLNEDRPKGIRRGIEKWERDIDIAYWQGYNNALIEKDEDY